MKACRAAIFDMDGTILDTITDLRDSLNYALKTTGHRDGWTGRDTALFFGSGVDTAVRRVLLCEAGRRELTMESLEEIGGPEDHRSEEEIREEQKVKEAFTPYYKEHCNDHTGPYAGIPNLIRTLRSMGIHTAVVSNKQDPAVQILAEHFFSGLFDAVLGEKEGIRRKPAPDMTLSIMEQGGFSREETVYIGDTEIDLQTAANAGIPCISVDWGFRSESFLRRKGAEIIVSDPMEIASLLKRP